MITCPTAHVFFNHPDIFLNLFIGQGKPGNGLCDPSGVCHLQQSPALLQRKVQSGPAPDAGGVWRVGHVCAPAGWLPGQCEREPTSYREVCRPSLMDAHALSVSSRWLDFYAALLLFFQFAGPDPRDVCWHQGDGNGLWTRHPGRPGGTQGTRMLFWFPIICSCRNQIQWIRKKTSATLKLHFSFIYCWK